MIYGTHTLHHYIYTPWFETDHISQAIQKHHQRKDCLLYTPHSLCLQLHTNVQCAAAHSIPGTNWTHRSSTSSPQMMSCCYRH